MSRNPCRGGAIAGIVLTVLVLAILSVVSLASLGVYVAGHWRVSGWDARGESTLETPFGSVRLRENDRVGPAAMGVPVYPGAVRDDDSRKLTTFRIDLGDHHKAFAVAAAGYRTSDSVEQVTEYYRRRLPHWMIADKGDGRVELSFTRGGYRRFVAICEEDGETHIGLASVGEPASN
ncbi:MAG TPA: hypothetical protein VMI94_28910 [Bryobacteraceae bacterium]|nr:hypothetical protein [Bryobacteraceae bacterium]